MYLEMQALPRMPEPERLDEILRAIRLGCHLFQGITDATMSHNEAWHFARLGRKLERADKTSRILDVKYFILLPSARTVGTPYDDIHWSAVLKSVSGFEMYRKKAWADLASQHRGFSGPGPRLPASIRFCIRSADESLHAITGTPMGSFVYASEQVMGLLRAELDFTPVDRIIGGGLHEYLDSLQVKMNTIDNSILNDFVTRLPAKQSQSQGQSQTAGVHAMD